MILLILLKKGECFDFNHSLGCVNPTLYIRLPCQVYHFSLLICYPCSMLKSHLVWNEMHLGNHLAMKNNWFMQTECKLRKQNFHQDVQ